MVADHEHVLRPELATELHREMIGRSTRRASRPPPAAAPGRSAHPPCRRVDRAGCRPRRAVAPLSGRCGRCGEADGPDDRVQLDARCHGVAGSRPPAAGAAVRPAQHPRTGDGDAARRPTQRIERGDELSPPPAGEVRLRRGGPGPWIRPGAMVEEGSGPDHHRRPHPRRTEPRRTRRNEAGAQRVQSGQAGPHPGVAGQRTNGGRACGLTPAWRAPTICGSPPPNSPSSVRTSTR